MKCPRCKGCGEVRDPARVRYFVVKSDAGLYAVGSITRKQTSDRAAAFHFRPDANHSFGYMRRWARDHARAMTECPNEMCKGMWRVVAVVSAAPSPSDENEGK